MGGNTKVLTRNLILFTFVTDTDDDKVTALYNLKKAAEAWGNLHRLLSYEKNGGQY